MNKQELIDQLTPKFTKQIATNMVNHYMDAKSEFLKGKPEYVGVKSGKFVEEVCCGLKYIVTGNIENQIKVGDIITELENIPKDSQPEEIRVTIPRVLFTIYTFRNKRNMAHSSKLDPLFMDAKFCISGIDWVLSELLRLFHNYQEEKIEKIIKEIIKKQIPIGQTLGDTTFPNDETLNLSDSFLVILYLKSKSRRDLYDYNIKFHQSKEDVITTLNNLELCRKIIGDRNNNYTITDKGIKYVEEELTEKFYRK